MNRRKRDALPEENRSDALRLAEGNKLLASFDRSQTEQLRIEWMVYKNNPYISMRVYEKDRDGNWWANPKKGTSVRLRELDETLSALKRAGAMAHEFQIRQRDERPLPTPRTAEPNVPPWVDLPKPDPPAARRMLVQQIEQDSQAFNDFEQGDDNPA